MLNGESLDVELWRGNLNTLDTLAHIPGTWVLGVRASQTHDAA